LDNVTIERTVSNGKALVSVREQAKVTMMGETSRIDGKKASFTGRGVEVQGTFNLEGGIIANHKATGATALVTDANVAIANKLADGSGVYVVNGGTFTMSGGYMEGNDTEGNMSGAAVSVNGTDATFTLSETGEIRNNSASYGAVMVRSGAFDMRGGKITGNTARNSGGGVIVSQGTFTMYGGEISGNAATANNGGGIYVNSSGRVTMVGGIISNNEAIKNGGGICVENANATLSLQSGSIEENYAPNGGGVAIMNCKKAEMTGGKITANKAYKKSLTSAEVKVLSSGALGGGVYVEASKIFTLTDGEISKNEARYGCGVFLAKAANNATTLNFDGGKITDNITIGNQKGNITDIDGGTGTQSDKGKVIYADESLKTSMNGKVTRCVEEIKSN